MSHARASAAEESAVDASARAVDAGSNADAYLLTTLFMASALFFAAGAARIVDLPIG